MSKTQVKRLVIVLFLLAALPGMTVVVAQGQEPAGKADSLAPSAEVFETQVSPSRWEVEDNDTRARANEIQLNDVVGGQLLPRETDVDFFKFYVAASGSAILFNTDARLDGYSTDTEITVYDSAGEVIGGNDDMGYTGVFEERDSLAYLVLGSGWYYVKVSQYAYSGLCGVQCYYELMVYSPLMISAAAANLGTATVEGISFRSEDILAFAEFDEVALNGSPQHKWMMLLDGSDVGFTKPLVNLSAGWNCYGQPCASMAVGFSANLRLRDIYGTQRTVKPWDWVIFNLYQPGPYTEISAIEYHSGAEHGLTTTAEKLDAIDIYNFDYAPGDYEAWVYLSTVGAASVNKGGGGTLKFADEDLLWSETQDGWGYWYNSLELDGSTIAGLGKEDIFAADYSLPGDRLYLTILGTGKVMNRNVTQKDIFVIYWNNTWNTWDGIAWHGPDWGWNYNIDAIDWPGG